MTRSTTLGAALAVLLGASALAPAAVQANPQGKWWTPRQTRERRVARFDDRRGFTRQWRTWGTRRVYRDVITIRASRGPRYRAWRTYCPPEYVYSRRIIRVRPIRFVVVAGFGSVGFHGGYYGDDYVYGCNFCDARFSSYRSYHDHVGSCGHRPHGYRVECSDWDTKGWDEDGWCEDRDDRYDRGHGSWSRDDDRWYEDRDRDDRDRDDEIDDDYDR